MFFLSLSMLIFAASVSAVVSTERIPTLLLPIDEEILFCGSDGATPRFSWDAGSVPRAVDSLPDTIVEISTSQDIVSGKVISDSVPAFLSRYVRASPLPLQNSNGTTYYWRIGVSSADSTSWSEIHSFSMMLPIKVIHISATVNDWGVVQKSLNDASSWPGPSLVQFEGSPRTLDPGSSTAFINFTSAADVIIDGGGSKITFSNYVTFALLLNCSRVSVQNFVFDFDPLPYTAVQISKVDTVASAISSILLPGHPTFESLLAFQDGRAGVYSTPSGLLDSLPSTKRGVPEVITYSNVTRNVAQMAPAAAKATEYRMSLEWGIPGWSGVQGLATGDVVVIDPRIYAGFNVLGGEDVTLRSLEVFACSNEGFTSEHAEALAILSCSTKVKAGRYIAANNGGHNHHGAAVGQWVEGGTWENAGDDTIHVSGLVMSVSSILTATDIELAASYPDEYALRQPLFGRSLGIRVGDTLEFFNRATGAMISRRKVLSLRPPAGTERMTGVTLDGDVGAVSTGVIDGGPLNGSITQVFNFDRTSNQFVFRRNTVMNGRRVGVLYKGWRSWIDSNVFVGLGGGALEMWNAPYEGLFAQSVLFRNNTVRDVCQLSRVAAPIWSFAGADGAANASSHSDVVIERNVFDTGPGPVFLLSDVADVTIRSNNITYCSASQVMKTSNVAGVELHKSNILTPSTDARLCVKTAGEDFLAPEIVV